MILGLDVRIINIDLLHSIETFSKSRLLKISFGHYQDLFFDLKNRNKGVSGGLFSIIEANCTMGSKAIEDNLLNGSLLISLLGDPPINSHGLETILTTQPIENFSLELNSTERIRLEQYYRANFIVGTIFGHKQVRLKLYTGLMQKPESAGTIEISLCLLTIQRPTLDIQNGKDEIPTIIKDASTQTSALSR